MPVFYPSSVGANVKHEADVSGLAVTVGDDGPTPVVLVEAREEVLPVFIAPKQAKAIGMALSDEPFERPLTHDLAERMLDAAGATIDRVRIDDFSDNTFYAKLDTTIDGSKEVFDARPSDAIALALRADADVYVTGDVLDAAGRDPEEIETESVEGTDGGGLLP